MKSLPNILLGVSCADRIKFSDNAVVISKDLKNKVAVTAFQEELQEGEIARGKEEIERLKDVAKVSKDLLDKQAKALPTGQSLLRFLFSFKDPSLA